MPRTLNPEIDDIDFTEEVTNAVADSKKFLTAALTCAGFEIKDTIQLANQYWPVSYIDLVLKNPWWLFKTDVGDIIIGPRKRVIVIDWEHTGAKVPDLTEDDVTKDDTFVHAWSREKVMEYLIALRPKLLYMRTEA